MATEDSAKPQRTTVPGSSVASRLAAGTGLERAIAGVVEETIVRTVESDAVIQAIERIVEDGRLQDAIERSIDPAMIEDAVRKAIRSEVSDRIWEDILASDKAQKLVERVAEAPEVRAAIAQQGFGLITDIGRQVSRITEALDDGLERVAHAILRRGDHEAETNQAGLATRVTAFAVDAALLFGFFSIVTGLFSSIIPTVFGDNSSGLSPLAIVLLSVAGFTVAAGLFVTFWTLIGQTPGMRFLGIRVQYHGSNEIPFWPAVKRVLAIPLALIPFGLGFLAILISPTRRGWHDHIAGTEVIYDEASAPWSLKPREWVNDESGPATAEGADDPGIRR
jgi:uncharacterized RDD family membrane protein YckC